MSKISQYKKKHQLENIYITKVWAQFSIKVSKWYQICEHVRKTTQYLLSNWRKNCYNAPSSVFLKKITHGYFNSLTTVNAYEMPNLASAIGRQLLNVSQNNLGQCVSTGKRQQTRTASSVQATSVPGQRQRRWPRSYGTEQRWPRSTQEAPYSHSPPAAPDVSDAQMTSLTDVDNGRNGQAPTCNTWLAYGFMMCLLISPQKTPYNKTKTFINKITFAAHQHTPYQLRLVKLYK